jgi:hypothetical protein
MAGHKQNDSLGEFDSNDYSFRDHWRMGLRWPEVY